MTSFEVVTHPGCYTCCSSGVVGVLRAEKKPSEVDTFVSRAKSLAFSAPSAASDVARQSGSHGDGVQERLAAGGGLWRMRDDGTREEQQESNRAKPTAVEAEPSTSKEEAKVRDKIILLLTLSSSVSAA